MLNSGGCKGLLGTQLWGFKFFQFNAFLVKFWQNRMLSPPMDPPLFKIVYYLKFEYFLHFSNFDVILIKLDKLVADSIFRESENGPQIF